MPTRQTQSRVLPKSRSGAALAVSSTALAGAFAFNRWSAAKAEREHPPLGKFLDIDGCRLHYFERGRGSPIVLIHGNGSLIEDFLISGVVDRLAERFRVILFDRPGYGHSTRPRGRTWTPEAQAELFASACEELGFERPLVVGHSWGTLPALAWALDRPDDVAGLVLISGYFFGTLRLDAVTTGIAALPGLGDVLTNTILPLQTRLTGPLGIKQIFSPEPVPDGFVDALPTGLMLRPSQLRATAADSAQMPLAAARLAKRYDELALPMAIIWGTGDKLVGQQGQSAALAERIPRARSLAIIDGGHMLHHTHPDDVAEAISDLAAEVLI